MQFSTTNAAIVLSNQITEDVIRKYIRHLFDSRLKETSVRRKIASLKAFLRFLEYRNDIPVSPFRKLNVHIRVPKRIPRYLSLDEVRTLLVTAKRNVSASQEMDGNRANTKRSSVQSFMALQRMVIIEVLFSTGVRVSELCSLNFEDVDLNEKTIRIFGKGSRERSVVFTHPALSDLLSRHLEVRKRQQTHNEALLVNRIGNRMQPHSVRAILKQLSQEANQPIKATPHMFRHTIATLLIENGVDIRFVQKLLGHSSILTTQIYTHLSTRAEREIIGSKHPRNLITLSASR